MEDSQNFRSKSHRNTITSLALDKIQSFRGTIGSDGEYLDPIYQSNASLAATIASDYRDRFLIELIQNAYDAQPANLREGRIKIVLDLRQGKNGTLYAANTGNAFTKDNLKDLCNIGLSRKPLGESIGNKGLGFRSVTQISDQPHIYSQLSDKPGENYFSGFCFRFAGESDYVELIDDERHRELACRDLPVFHVPVPLQTQSDAARTYAENGFSTAIELPLRNATAQSAVRREFEELRSQRAPLLLFLDRVRSLELAVINLNGDTETQFAFSRSEELQVFEKVSLSRVNLGEAGIFLVARRPVHEETMLGAISEAISSKELNEHWANWSGNGEIATAVRLDAAVEAPRLYTYLPMGEQAEAPFPGHLHGSFFPSSNRKNLNARNKLNAVLLDEATSLVADTIREVVTDPSGRLTTWLAKDERAAVVSDLLSWEQVGSLTTDDDLAAAVADKVAQRRPRS